MNVEDIGERQVRPPVRALMVGKQDNVALLLGNVKAGEVIVFSGGRIEIAVEDIPAGFKIAAQLLHKGQSVITYGQVIGTALCPIKPGESIHHLNLGKLQ